MPCHNSRTAYMPNEFLLKKEFMIKIHLDSRIEFIPIIFVNFQFKIKLNL